MKLDNVIAKRPTKTIYRDGDTVIKLFNEDYLKSDILNEALNRQGLRRQDYSFRRFLRLPRLMASGLSLVST